MSKQSYCSLPIQFSVKDEMSNGDTRFLNCTIDVLHTSVNYNNSVFTREVVDENIDTIKNTPVLGFVRKMPDGENDFKGHEYIITKDENGVRRKNIGSAWGVIPESCNPRWYQKTLDTGEEVEVLQVDALLWSKLEDGYDILTRDIEKGQSMELQPESVEGYEDEETGLFHFTKFSFDGCTILGDGIQPAMQDANITINFSMSDFVKNIQSELIDKYSEFSKLVSKTTDTTIIKLLNENKEGGRKMNFAQTAMELFSDISSIVRGHDIYVDRWGDTCARYSLHDIQGDEAIVVDHNDYHYYGVPFVINGDKPELDFANLKRKKTCYEDYMDSNVTPDGAFDFGSHISELQETAHTKYTEIESKLETIETEKNEVETNYTTMKAEFETTVSELETIKAEFETVKAKLEDIEPKYNEYVQADEQRKVDEINAQKDAKISEFEEALSDVTEFTELKEKKNEMSVEEIESKCAVMFYKKNIGTDFSKKTDGIVSTHIYTSNEDKESVVPTKYGNITIRR